MATISNQPSSNILDSTTQTDSANASSSSNNMKRMSERIANMQNSSNSNSQSTSNINMKNMIMNDLIDDSAQRRRSSSRSIKRKKFDDELVDSMSTSYPKPKLLKTPTGDPQDRSFGTSDFLLPESNIPIEEPPAICDTPVNNKKQSKVSATPNTTQKKKIKKQLNISASNKCIEENNYWKPTDDLALIINVEQTNNLVKVHKGVKFSSKFSLSEIESRWRSLLYDCNVKSLSLAAIRQLHPDVVNQIESKALFSEAEEALLIKIESRNEPSTDSLQELINSNAEIFLPSRTPKILLKHWLLLRHYQLLSDQILQPLPRHESVVSFSEIENIVRQELDEEMKNPNLANTSSNEVINQEIMHSIRKNMLEIRMLENEIPKYQSLLDSITGIAPSDFDNQTFAVLRGRLVRYLMRSKEITIGRSTKDFVVDVDLSLEGPSTKISRLQAIIYLQPTGEFIMYNTGKRPVYIDSKPLLPDSSLRINHNSLIEFGTLKFIFLINQDLISNIRNDILQVCK